jgi:hypothetical protein
MLTALKPRLGGPTMLSVDQMKALVDEIVALGNELRAFGDHDDTPARPRPSATAAALADFKRRYGGRVPPSYLQLLSIYDGVDNFDWVDVSILSTEFLLAHDDLDEDWVEEAEAFAAGEAFIFAQSDSDAHIVAFLSRKVGADGEMKVVHLDSDGPIGKHKNLEAYLRERRDWFAEAVAEEKADRAGLSDDE